MHGAIFSALLFPRDLAPRPGLRREFSKCLLAGMERAGWNPLASQSPADGAGPQVPGMFEQSTRQSGASRPSHRALSFH